MTKLNALSATLGVALTSLACAQATSSPDPKPDKFLVGFQATGIEQALLPFHSPYEGPNSLQSVSQGRFSDTYTLYLGARVQDNVDVYVDPEMARGAGISNALGLAGYTNGDVIRNPSLGQNPYLARYFVRWTLAASGEQSTVERGENQIAGKVHANRLVLSAGKMGTNDIFDTNAYANSTRTQFMNWALINNAAYDYAADTRGYSIGGALEWIHPTWTLRAGSFEMPKVANGPDLMPSFSVSRGDQVELETHPTLLKNRSAATVRYMGFRNIATMGDYRQAVALAPVAGVPDITATRSVGRIKYGLGVNVEQPLADEGNTGLFARLGWADGRTESFAYTEADDHVSLGFQLSGSHWHRPDDRLGVAFVSDGLSGPHRAYLEAGGLGFILGDGKLNYGRENIVEAYATRQLTKAVGISLDAQAIQNPGYNKDRGPVPVLSARLHVEL